MTAQSAAAVRLAAIRSAPLSVDEVLAAVAAPAVGGTTVFVGAVRDRDEDRDVVALSYSAHPSAEVEMARVAGEVASSLPEGGAVAAVHRVGDLQVGDLAVVVAAGCPHRDEAFRAARVLIDRIKAEVPIWKHQRFADGTEEWVGAPE
ncbi:MAG TPA: molybdenum cofactor biosynthesis protein MoaE [Mycobacteriales bacterium]|nr:molybdenum cofactor biosynthesis protein MoaE [Mycobacteriales bacterium]